jgi:NADH-quinone oxidoreductase subunit D
VTSLPQGPDTDFDLETIDLNINMGPQHPSTHGVFRMVLQVDGELIKDVVPHIGYMHRGSEKLPENCDYRQAIGYVDRTDYLAQFNCEHAYVQATEKLLGIEAPERAEWARLILSELNRLSSHFMFMGAFGTDIGIFGTAFTYAFREREFIQDLFEEVTGDRLMYSYFRVGGLGWDVTANFKQRVREVIKQAQQGIKDVDGLLSTNEVFLARTRGIGIITQEQAIDWGCTGPVIRSTGLPIDVRKLEPYSFYDQLQFDVPVGQIGDVYDRYLVRLEEMRQSIRIIEQALDKMPDSGPILPERLPRLLRAPAGEVYSRVEAPRGEYGIYIMSKGGPKPWRFKVRAPCFSNLSALREMTIGHYIADAVVILGSIDIVLCAVDR